MMLNMPKTTTSNVILTIAVFIVFNVLLPIDYCHHHHVLVMAKKSSHKGVTKRGDKNEGHHGSSPSSGGKTNKAAGGAIPTRFEDLTSRSDITPTKRSSSSYVGCTLCGEGVEMLNPDGIVTTGQDQTVTCAQLEANSVHLPSDGIACQKLQELTFVTCQCRGWDSVQRTTDSTGAFVAEDSDIAGELVSTNVSTNSTNSTEFVCEVCRGGGVIGNPNGLVMDTTTGVPTFCSVLHENRMNISETACPRIQAFAFAACECSIPPEQNITADVNLGVEESGSEVGELYSCPVCGPDGVIGNPNGLVTNARGQTARCSLLEANQGSVPPNACSTLQELAREPCDCLSAPLVGTEESESTSNPAVCSICGEGIITIPEGIVTNTQGREARCDVMQANAASIPDDLCESIQAMARTSCGCARIVNNDPQNIGQNQTSGNEVINVNSTTNELDVGNSTSTTLTCPICGNGVMNNPDGIVVTRQGQAARCTVLNANANTIPESACPTIQALSNIPCGCAESDEQLNGTNGKEAGDEQEIFVCKVCGDNQSIRDPNRRIVTSLGVYTCSNAYAAGLIGGIPEDHCDSLRISVAEECGCVADGPTEAPTAEPYMCSICSDGRVVTTADGRMDVSLAALGGASGLTCGQYEIAASRGQIAEDECAAIQSLSESPCGCKLPEFSPTPAPTGFVCPICGEGMVVGYPDGEVILPNTQRMSCGGLQMRAEMNIIQPTQCAQIQPFVRESCKCVVESFPDPTYAPTQYECNICGEGRAVTDSNGIVVIPTQPDRTCGELMAAAEFGYITPNQCSLLNPFTQSPCKCITVDTTVPSDMPSSPPTGPTVSPAPTTIMEREDCYASLSEIYELERVIADTSTQRKYVLCPRRTFHMGIWTEDGRGIKDGEQFIALRPNVIYQCGEDGSRNNNCILKGGDFGLASYYGVYSGIYESVENVEIRGLTFESQNLFSAVLKSAGDISFIGCAFKGNTNSVPVLIQWEGEGPDEAGTTQSSRALRRLDDGTSQSSNIVSHVVTFQDCVFRDNALGDNMFFPGVIENSFLSEIVITNCLFENNRFGIKDNPAPVGYAVRSFGPTTIESSCFVNNVFSNYGPVVLYGNQYSAFNNYVEPTQSDLTCEFTALFSSQDEIVDGNVPQCELSDAISCAFSQPPTLAPSVGPTPAPVKPTPAPALAPDKQDTASGSSGSSSLSQRILVWSSSYTLLLLLPALAACLLNLSENV